MTFNRRFQQYTFHPVGCFRFVLLSNLPNRYGQIMFMRKSTVFITDIKFHLSNTSRRQIAFQNNRQSCDAVWCKLVAL